MECFKCGVSDNRSLLYDVISSKGIIQLCRKCSSDEALPIIKRPTSFQVKESWQSPTVREVLSRVSGVKEREKQVPKKDPQLEIQEAGLKQIAERNLQKSIMEKQISTDNLIDNFHWLIMRARRMRKMTQEQLAKAIGESEAAIKMIEQGIVSEQTPQLINKIESYLGVKIKKSQIQTQEKEFSPSSGEPLKKEVFFTRPEFKKELPKETEHELSFDPVSTKTLTIADLKEMKQEEEEEIFDKKEEDELEKKWEEQDKKMEKDLSEGEIDDLIFGRKEDL